MFDFGLGALYKKCWDTGRRRKSRNFGDRSPNVWNVHPTLVREGPEVSLDVYLYCQNRVVSVKHNLFINYY